MHIVKAVYFRDIDTVGIEPLHPSFVSGHVEGVAVTFTEL